MAEHLLNKWTGMPMEQIPLNKDKVTSFVTYDMVMEGDEIVGPRYKGTVKEILEERPSKGRWADIGDGTIPTMYKVRLY